VPDSNRHVFSIGAGYTAKRWEFSVGYQFTLSEDRTIPSGSSAASPFVDGDWEAVSHGLSATWLVKF
jgi:long-subunit fatty acid transport protein